MDGLISWAIVNMVKDTPRIKDINLCDFFFKALDYFIEPQRKDKTRIKAWWGMSYLSQTDSDDVLLMLFDQGLYD